MEIIGVGSKIHNNPSEVDGVGTKMLSIPSKIFHKIMKIPAFDWIMENNNNVSIFMKLNPQFDYDFRERHPDNPIPSFVLNKDGNIFDIETGAPLKRQK